MNFGKEQRLAIGAFLFIIIVLIFASVFLWQDNEKQKQICFKKYCFYVELALTEQERERGLMFKKNLDFNKGMLFVFNEEGRYPFWMKNTLIPLDIIWLSKEKEVVFINKNAQPCIEVEEACPVIDPGAQAQYVLELKSGQVERTGLKVGDRVSF